MTNTPLRSISRRLQAAREKSGLTQTDLAMLLGRRQPSVSLVETGGVMPSLGTMAVWVRCCASAIAGRGDGLSAAALLEELPELRELLEQAAAEADAAHKISAGSAEA